MCYRELTFYWEVMGIVVGLCLAVAAGSAGCGRSSILRSKALNDNTASDEIALEMQSPAKWTEYQDSQGRVTKLLAYHGRLDRNSMERLKGNYADVCELVCQECTGLTAETLEAVAELSNLRRLAILNSPLPETALEGIAKIRHLQSLQLVNCGLKGDRAQLLQQLALEELEVTDRDLSPEAASKMSAIAALKVLRVGSPGVNITDLVGAAGHNNLEELDVRHCRAVDGWIDLVCQIPHLKRLYFDGRILNDSIVEGLTKIQTLEALDLSSSPITDEGLARLAQLPNLAELILRNCEKLSDGALDVLARFPKLAHLDISESAISGEALPRLIPLTSLSELTVHQMQLRGGRSAGLQRFREARPDCAVNVEQDLMF